MWQHCGPMDGGGAYGDASLRRQPLSGRWVRDLLGYLVLQACFVAVLLWMSPGFFWLDDQQIQFLPVYVATGALLLQGDVPVLDLGLGGAGNFLADPQFGVLDPLHWVVSVVVSQIDDLSMAATVLGVGAMVLLGTGVVSLGLRWGAPSALSVAAAVGTASTGFYLWFGSSWWPSMLGLALLPWLWLGLVSRHPSGVVLTGLSAWALVGSGHPYSLVLAAVLVLAHLAETASAAGTLRGLLDRSVVSRVLAGVGGVVAGAPTLLGALQAAPVTTRAAPETALGNLGVRIPNALDAALGGVTLSPVISGDFAGSLLVPPVAATFVLAVPALALVSWRTALRRPGVLTAVVVTSAALVLTQMPTYVATFRYPFRYLAAVGTWLPLLMLTALAAGALVTRGRLALAGALVLGQVALATMRVPAQLGWHVVAGGVGLVGIAALVVVIRSRRPDDGPVVRRRPRRALAVAGAVLFLVGSLGPLLGLAVDRSIARDRDVAAGGSVDGRLERLMPQRLEWSPSSDDIRAQVVAADESVTLPVWDVGPNGGWDLGVLEGNAALVAEQRTGFGYTAAGHRAWNERWCSSYRGGVSSEARCVDGLLEEVPGTGRTWLDLLSSDVVLLQEAAPDRVREHFRGSPAWIEEEPRRAVDVFTRTDPLPPRVAWTSAGLVRVEAQGSTARYAAPTDVVTLDETVADLTVSTTSEAARVVLRVPSWPGLEADLDGREVTVGSVEGIMATVELPAGLDEARLVVRYSPLATKVLLPAAVSGLLLIAVAVLTDRRRRVPHPSSPEDAGGATVF